MTIGIFKKIKQFARNVLYGGGHQIRGIAQSKIINKLIKPAAVIGGMIPIVGPLVEKSIENAPKTFSELGNLMINVGEGIAGGSRSEAFKNVLESLHKYTTNTQLIGNPLNSISLPAEGIYQLHKVLSKKA